MDSFAQFTIYVISTHTPHARRDRGANAVELWFSKFQLTRLMRGVTRSRAAYCRAVRKFQLTRLMRGVTNTAVQYDMYASFQLTRLMRGVTHQDDMDIIEDTNFNSHASCEA